MKDVGKLGFLVSKQQAALMLGGVDRKTVDKYLKEIDPDDEKGSHPKWYIRTVVKAMLPYLNRKYAFDQPGDIDPDRLEPKDRKDHYDAENKRLAYESSMRTLIPVEEVRGSFSGACKVFATSLDNLPDILKKEAGLTDEQYDVLNVSLDEAREKMFFDLSEYACSDQQKT